MVKKLTQEEVIQRFKAVHGDKYDYSFVEYKNIDLHVNIVCSHHGRFSQTPYRHLKSNGCPKCARDAGHEKRIKTTEWFINKSRKIHGDTYNYQKAVYTANFNEVIITCKVHGDFSQKAIYHTSGNGCDKCGDNKISNLLRLNSNEFIERARAIHGDLYDYSMVEYTGNRDKIIIKCNRCELVFTQTPHNHTSGKSGCIICNSGGGGFSGANPAFLYVLLYDNYTKVGITNREVQERIKQIHKSSGIDFREVYRYNNVNGKICNNVETSVLRVLRESHKSPTVRFDGSSETFLDVDLEWLIQVVEETVKKEEDFEKTRKERKTYLLPKIGETKDVAD